MPRTERQRKTLVIGVVILVLLLLSIPKIWGLFRKADPSSLAGSPRSQAIGVRYFVVHSKTIPETIATIGTILSNEEIEVRSEIVGKIQEIRFAEGQRVAAGDVLVKINDEELQAQLLSARARKDLASMEQERVRQLFEKNLVSQRDFDTAVNSLKTADAAVQLIEAQIRKTSLRAPFAGRMSLRFVSTGSYVDATTLIATLHDDSRVKIDFTFPEKYAGKVRKGDAIGFTTGESKDRFSGTIYAITPKIDPATRSIRARALAANPRGALVPGGFATIEIPLRSRPGMAVPAYTVIPEMKAHKVLLFRNGRAVEQAVDVGARNEKEVEILTGLAEGDTVIATGLLQIRPGAPVQLTEAVDQ